MRSSFTSTPKAQRSFWEPEVKLVILKGRLSHERGFAACFAHQKESWAASRSSLNLSPGIERVEGYLWGWDQQAFPVLCGQWILESLQALRSALRCRSLHWPCLNPWGCLCARKKAVDWKISVSNLHVPPRPVCFWATKCLNCCFNNLYLNFAISHFLWNKMPFC